MTMTKKERERASHLRAGLTRMSRQGWKDSRPLSYKPLERELAELEERANARSVKPEEIVARYNAATEALKITSRMSYSPRGGWFTVRTGIYDSVPSKYLRDGALRAAIHREEQLAKEREQNVRKSARTARGVMLPQVHLNGTSRDELLAQVREAHIQIKIAMDALCKAAPHGRDYYTIPGYAENEAINLAQRDHEGRVRALNSVLRDLQEISDHLLKGDNR